jgi:hypothetical protein
MKKLLVVLASLLLVAGLAFTAMAADPVKFSGEFDYTIMSDFSDSTEGWGNFYADIDMHVDQYNKVRLEVWGAHKTDLSAEGMGQVTVTAPGAGQAYPLDVGYFYLESDVGAAADLPIGLKAQAGITSIYSSKFEVTGHGWERAFRPYADPLAVVAKTDFNGTFMLDAGFGRDAAGALATIPEIGPAKVEIYYLSPAGTIEGWLGGNFKAVGMMDDMLDVAGMFTFNLGDDGDDATADSFYWGIGGLVKYNILKVGLSVKGNDVDVLDKLAIDVDAKFTDLVGGTVAAALSFAEDTDTFWGADLSLYVTPGKSTWRVGYAITDGNGYTYGGNVGLPEGGAYISAGIDF